MQTKKCTKCERELPATDDFFHRKSGPLTNFRAQCRNCRNEIVRIKVSKNRKLYNKKKSDWFKNNPEKAYQINLRKNFKRNSSYHEPYTLEEVFEKYGTDCYLCGREIDLAISRLEPEGLNIEHVVPRSKGGPDTLANVRPSHRKCNLDKGTELWDNQLQVDLLALQN